MPDAGSQLHRAPLPMAGRRVLRRRSSGFTLIEVLVTMALMAVVVPVVMRGLSISMAAASSARHSAEAAALGEAKLTEMATNLQLGATDASGGSGNFGDQFPDYTWEVTSMDNTDLGVTQLVMTVSWKERGQPRQLVLSTLAADPTDTTTTTGATGT